MAEDTTPTLPATPPLVGREREQATLRTALAAALAGRGSLVLIGGEAGIGKTALAEWLLAEAEQQAAQILIGRCYDLSETPPYGPWREALATYRTTAGLPAPPAGLAVAGASGQQDAATSQEALFGQARDFFVAVAERQPLALLLDDLHWSDPASRDLLRFLGRQLAAHRLLTIATYRSDELTRRHPLYALLPVLVRETHAARLDLRPLAGESLAALVDARYHLTGPDTARLVAYLRAHAEGNPFYTGELLRTLEEEGLLRPLPGTSPTQAGDGWQLGDPNAASVPPLLRQVIDRRLARLGDEAVRLLAIAAVVGQVVSHDLWAAVADTTEEVLLDAVERAVEARILAESPADGGYRFAHALIREVLYEGIVLPRRRAWHRRIAEVLAAHVAAEPDTIAHHFLQAGDRRAYEWLVRAGERALRSWAWLTAAERFEAALVLLERDGAAERERAALLLTLAQLRRYADIGQTIAMLDEAIQLAERAGDATLVAAARFDQGHHRCLLGEWRRGLQQMEEALPMLEALTPAERAQLPAMVVLGVAGEEDFHRAVLVQFLATTGRLAKVQALGAPFLDPASTVGARGLVSRAFANVQLGRLDATRRAFTAAAEHYRAAGQWVELANILISLLRLNLDFFADEPLERERLVAEATHSLARARGMHTDNLVPIPALLLQLATGSDSAALVQAAGLLASQGLRMRFGHDLDWLATLAARRRGEHDLAWRFVRAHLPDGAATEPGNHLLVYALRKQSSAASLCLDAGDLPAARTWLDARDRWLAWSGTMLGRAEGQLGWAAYYRACGEPIAAREHAERALDLASLPRQPLMLLAAHRLLGELATASGAHSVATTHLGAALTLADACAFPYERALTLLALAERYAATRQHGEGRVLLGEACALLEPLAAAPALARAATLAARLTAASIPATDPTYPAGLSAREAEVLALVAHGLTNVQMAERLFLSRRTIDQHLRSIYAKLGVENRAAAAAFAVEHGLR